MYIRSFIVNGVKKYVRQNICDLFLFELCIYTKLDCERASVASELSIVFLLIIISQLTGPLG